jgi:hypothetical protein
MCCLDPRCSDHDRRHAAALQVDPCEYQQSSLSLSVLRGPKLESIITIYGQNSKNRAQLKCTYSVIVLSIRAAALRLVLLLPMM